MKVETPVVVTLDLEEAVFIIEELEDLEVEDPSQPALNKLLVALNGALADAS
jgi:hypothetical protein